jgi:hypothetical protein
MKTAQMKDEHQYVTWKSSKKKTKTDLTLLISGNGFEEGRTGWLRTTPTRKTKTGAK